MEKKHPLTYFVTLPPHFSTYPHLSALFETGKSWIIHLHYSTNAAPPALNSLICLSIHLFYSSFLFRPRTEGRQQTQNICGWSFRFRYRGEKNKWCLCVQACVWSCLVGSGGDRLNLYNNLNAHCSRVRTGRRTDRGENPGRGNHTQKEEIREKK